MGIWEIDGVNKDYEGRRLEEDFHIKLVIYNRGEGGVSIDVEITPIFCPYCNKQVENFYKHAGSRYGQVGEAGCNHCGSVIYCTDNDNMVDVLRLTSTNKKTKTLEYRQLYGLKHEIWNSLKDKTGYDVFARHENGEWTTLQSIIDDICSFLHIQSSDLPSRQIITDPDIPVLPKVVTKWLNLLEYLNIK